MLGKTLHKAKIKDGKIVLESKTIQLVGRKLYYFDEQGICGCMKSDVGVVIFLTPKEAMDYLISNLVHSVECGESYLKKTREQLKKARSYALPEE